MYHKQDRLADLTVMVAGYEVSRNAIDMARIDASPKFSESTTHLNRLGS